MAVLCPQTSLNKLLETLGKAEPFFIRCIRSNAAKVSIQRHLGVVWSSGNHSEGT